MRPLWYFRDRSDVVPVTLMVVTLVASLLPFFVTLSGWAFAVDVAAAVWFRGFIAYTQHNHAHLKVFSNRALNALYDVLLAQCTGYVTPVWELHHVRGHHRHFLDAASDVAGIVNPATGRLRARWWYALRGNLRIHYDSLAIARAERGAGRGRLINAMRWQLTLQTALTVVLLAWRPGLTLLFFVVPNLLTAFCVWWESYPHHREVPGQSMYDGSVTVLSWFQNWRGFNIGHHTAHHEKPTLHWSLLPRRTQEIAARIPAACMRGELRAAVPGCCGLRVCRCVRPCAS